MRLMHVCSKCRTEWESEGVPSDKELCATCTPRLPEFKEFRKIPRLSREIIITEKIDGTNGVIYIDEQNNIFAGSRNRWLWGSIQEEIHNDNRGFAKWVKANKEELLQLGKGYHYGEWWGKGIQRGYGLEEKKFSLFNVSRWVKKEEYDCISLTEGRYLPILKEHQEYCPDCCDIVPVLFIGEFDTSVIRIALNNLEMHGSFAANGYMNPEGIVIYHTAAGTYFKKTIKDDEKAKTETI